MTRYLIVISFKRFDLFNIGTIKYQVFKSWNWESNLGLTLSCPIFFKSINMMVVFGIVNFVWHHSLHHQPPIFFCSRPCRYLTRPVSTTIYDDFRLYLERRRSVAMVTRNSFAVGGHVDGDRGRPAGDDSCYSCCIGGVSDERLRSLRLDDSC